MRPFDLSTFDAPLTVPELRNGPILLRPFALSDLPLIREAAEDPYIPSITSVPPAYSDDNGRAFIERQQRLAIDGHGYPFVIADASSPHQGLGALGLWLREIENGRASIGYWIVPAARGRHAAGLALQAAVAYAFDVLAIPVSSSSLSRGTPPHSEQPSTAGSPKRRSCTGGSGSAARSMMPTATRCCSRTGTHTDPSSTSMHRAERRRAE